MGLMLPDGHCRILRPYQKSRGSSVSLLQRFLWRHQVLYGLLLEIGSCYHRIRLLCKQGRAPGLDMGSVWLPYTSGNLIQNTTSQGRIRDIEKLRVAHPWASTEDVRMFLNGWDAGREHGVRTGGLPGEEPIGCDRS
jgi:hypothetical protein